ncbi:type I restriction endonuclease, partial [Vibrio aestuarianus]
MTYTEDGLVEQPAIALFDSLDWDTETCWDEAFGDAEGDLAFGRETRNDIVLTNRLREALLKLNEDISSLILQEAMDEMCRDRSSMSDIAANEAIYLLLKDGYTYTATSDDEEDYVVRYIDWETADNNDFLLCSQMSISGEIETRRPDLLGFVNGLPLLFVELKTSHKNLLNAYKDNLKDYRNTIPRLFHYNQIIVL